MADAAESAAPATDSAVPKLTTTLEVSVADLGAVQFDPAKPASEHSSSSALLPLTTKEYVRLHLPMIIKTIAVVLVAALISTLIGVQSINIRACNSTATDGEEEEEEEVSGVSSFVGIGIACVANAFNGGGMSLQKVGHNRVAAAAGGTTDVNSVGHFKQPMWWLGLLLIIAGEGGNAFAYGLAPASTVAPFGGIGVFTNYVIAVLCLGEKSRLGLGLGVGVGVGVGVGLPQPWR